MNMRQYLLNNQPKNAEEFHRWCWEQDAPELLKLMGPGDPGPLPKQFRTDWIDWPEDDGDEIEDAMEDLGEALSINEEDDPEVFADLLAERRSLNAYLADGPAARARRGGHVHAEPTATVRRHLKLVR